MLKIKGPKIKVPVAKVRQANETMRALAEDNRSMDHQRRTLARFASELVAERDRQVATYHGDLAAVFCVGFGIAGWAAVLVGVLQ